MSNLICQSDSLLKSPNIFPVIFLLIRYSIDFVQNVRLCTSTILLHVVTTVCTNYCFVKISLLGCAFVRMQTKADAEKCIVQLHNTMTLQVSD